MQIKNKKIMVTIELCDRDDGKEYKGRLLGLINDNEFYRVMNSGRLQNKLFSSRTVPLSEVANYADLEGLRLVIAVKEMDNKIIGGKHLFITGRLNYVTLVGSNEEQIGVLSENDEYLLVSEEE